MSVLFNGSIKQQFAQSLAVAIVLSGASVTTTGAQPLGDTIATAAAANSSASVLTESSLASDIPVLISDSSVLSDNAPATRLSSNPTTGLAETQNELKPANSSNVLVHAHEIDGRRAATLYIKDIPVLTFIGTELDSLSNNSDAVSLAANDASSNLQASAAPAGDILDTNLENDPVLRASNLGEELVSGDIEATDISVRWNENNEDEGYIVTLADEDLIALDSRTILPDTTADLAEDALQVTNRLRRLLGDAEPVSEIEGLPEPEPEPVVETAPVEQVAIVSSNVGGASWYGPGFHGRTSANGETFDQYALTAAHRSLPFGTYVLVTNLYNGRQVTVRINDRGPYAGDRIIDLSMGAAEQIGLVSSGVGTVQIDILGY